MVFLIFLNLHDCTHAALSVVTVGREEPPNLAQEEIVLLRKHIDIFKKKEDKI